MRICRTVAGVAAVLLLVTGCATGGRELRRTEGAGPVPRSARIGLAEFRRCGAAYLDRLNPSYYGQDAKAGFLLECTERGYPGTFQARLRQRLEERLGRKLVPVRPDRPFLVRSVAHDGEKQGLEYVLSGDLLAMGETAGEAVVSAYLFAVRVADRKVVLLGMVRKTGPPGRLDRVIDQVADELYDRAFEE